MDLRIDIERKEELLLVTASGTVKFESALRLLRQICDAAAEDHISRILVDPLAVEGELAAHERYRIGVDLATYVMQREIDVKMALVGLPPTLNGFGVLVAHNRGMDAKVFPAPEGAMRWLNDLPAEPSRESARTFIQDR